MKIITAEYPTMPAVMQGHKGYKVFFNLLNNKICHRIANLTQHQLL